MFIVLFVGFSALCVAIHSSDTSLFIDRRNVLLEQSNFRHVGRSLDDNFGELSVFMPDTGYVAALAYIM